MSNREQPPASALESTGTDAPTPPAADPAVPRANTLPTDPNLVATPHAMQVDVLGFIRTAQVPLHAAFHPVFEAVVNSIHATQDRFDDEVSKKGDVEVHIHRVPQRDNLLGAGRPAVVGISGFTVTDNGIGFGDKNLLSFETAYSRAKVDRGGKGVGRFSWLVLCRQAVIDSVFERHDGPPSRRRFAFKPTQRGIEDFEEESVADDVGVATSVKLEQVQDKYFDALRRGTDFIVERLFEQCFGYLVVGRCPRITVIDEFADGTVRAELNERLGDLSIGDPVDIQVGNHVLQVRHVQLPSRSDRRHEAHLCGNHRVVTSFPLSQISDLGSTPLALDSGAQVVHHVFVSGDVLDKSVDTTRTRLDLAEDASLFAWAGSVDMKSLRAALGTHVNEHLAPLLNAARDTNFRQIEDHIRKVQPEYLGLLKRTPDELRRLDWTDNTRQMDENLYRVQQAWEAEVRRKQAEVEQKLDDEKADPDAVAEELVQVMQQVNEAGQANLVRYVAKRRAVITFMKRLVARKALEGHVHRIVFPMRTTNQNVEYDDHNLWLLDDTLSFYDFIASDMPFSEIQAAAVDSDRRPDILAFKTGDPPFQHVALVEFKRPERKDDNPVQQLVEYAVLLREGGAHAADGTKLPGIPKSVRIDGYAVATLTAELEQRVRVGPGNMQKVEGDWRWLGGVPAENLTIELVDFTIFVARAEQRNRAFFTKLGLP